MSKIERRNDVLLGVSVYNESEHIIEWLTHWSKLVDDIVVVDQESTDNTVELVKGFIKDNPGLVELYRAPRMGKCEPVYQPIQVMAAACDKWMLKMDIDEYMTPKQFNKMITLAIKANKIHHTSAFILARKNMVDGIDVSRIFANPNDPHGRDWQVRLCKGAVLNFGFGSHTHPAIVGRWAMLNPDEVMIEHRRTFSGIVRANITREEFLEPGARQGQRAFIVRLGELLGKTNEEVDAEVKQYV